MSAAAPAPARTSPPGHDLRPGGEGALVRSTTMLAGRPGLSPLMVGRSAALGRLVGLLDAEGSSAPSVALDSGEAGVGKTRLLRELVSAAPAGMPVLAGQAE